MRKRRSPSKATQLTLQAMADSASGLHGYEIMKMTGIGPGTLYPMLARLEDRGFLSSEWETTSVGGRPPRHIYSLTQTGRAFAANMVNEQSIFSIQEQGSHST